MNRRTFFNNILGTLACIPASALAGPILSTKTNLTLLETELAGFQYYAGEKLWSKISIGDRLAMSRESGNPYDRRAVALFWRRFKLGYVPRIDNAVIAQLLERGTSMQCRIVEKNEADDPWQRIRFIIELIA